MKKLKKKSNLVQLKKIKMEIFSLIDFAKFSIIEYIEKSKNSLINF